MVEENKKDEYTQVLLEEVRGHYKALAEALDGVTQKTNKIDGLEETTSKLSDDMDIVKTELRLIRSELKEKVDRDEFILLEQKVEKLEKIVLAH